MPNKDLIKARKQFVGQRRKAARSNEMEAAAKMALGQPSKRGPSDAASRKAFFIKTRVEELKAAGKKVDRKKLAARYESGKVKREEFYAGGAKEKARRQAAAKPKPTTGSSKPSTKPSAKPSTKPASKPTGSVRAFESPSKKPAVKVNPKGGTLYMGSKAAQRRRAAAKGTGSARKFEK